ncbi:hypothetical protein HJG60_007986 [Phyllostomus discolor]|uniref:Uncharacterized protein n=1 Tax=Phyllostomus discolor TaxID=89673 RepID=A0A834BHV2_9CHIR|nr:hypothetical protein HJG60_007986 [Phyllostomus discolor]
MLMLSNRRERQSQFFCCCPGKTTKIMILQRRGQKCQLPDALMSVQLIPAFMHMYHCDSVKPMQCQRGALVYRAWTALESYGSCPFALLVEAACPPRPQRLWSGALSWQARTHSEHKRTVNRS